MLIIPIIGYNIGYLEAQSCGVIDPKFWMPACAGMSGQSSDLRHITAHSRASGNPALLIAGPLRCAIAPYALFDESDGDRKQQVRGRSNTCPGYRVFDYSHEGYGLLVPSCGAAEFFFQGFCVFFTILSHRRPSPCVVRLRLGRSQNLVVIVHHSEPELFQPMIRNAAFFPACREMLIRGHFKFALSNDLNFIHFSAWFLRLT